MADKKVIDVAGPIDAKVDIGSKPMIVGHKSMASDPMMREKQAEPEKPESPDTPSQETVAIKEDIASKPEEIEPPSVKQKTIEPIGEVKKLEEKLSENPAGLTTDIVSSEKSDITEKSDAMLDKEAIELEKEENLRKIIESKKYHVNIKQAHASKKSFVYVVMGLFVAVFVGLFVLVDTGKLDPGFSLPFSIFGDDTSTTESTQLNNDEVSKVTDTVEPALEETVPTVVSKITKVNLLLKESGDEAQLPENTPISFVDYMKERLATFNCDTEAGGYTIKIISEEFVGGSVGCDGGFSAVWYAQSDIWQEFGAQDTAPCSDIIRLKIPEEFIATCLDLDTASEKKNPNGSIDI